MKKEIQKIMTNKTETLYTFSSRLKQLREEHDMTQEQLAQSLGVSRTCITNWEGMLRFPKGDILAKMARIFGVSADYLCGRTDVRYHIKKPQTREMDMSVLNVEGNDMVYEFFNFIKSKAKYRV